MTEIDFTDEKGDLIPYAAAAATIFATYPKCPTSRSQAFHIFQWEAKRYFASADGDFESNPPQDFRISELAETVLKGTRGKQGRRYACGLMALALVTPTENGDERTIDGSARLVAAASKPGTRIQWVDPFLGTYKERNAVGNVDQIEDAFKEFAPAAHIIAVETMTAGIIDPAPLFGVYPERDAKLLRTLVHYDELLRLHSKSGSWSNLATLKVADSVMELEPLEPPQELLDALFG